jgi:molybdenum cofactor cytidylyltransferase
MTAGPIDNSDIDVQGIILCAGGSRRFGSSKMLADFRGRPLFAHALDAAIESNLSKLQVIINDKTPLLREAIEFVQNSRIELLVNRDFEKGMSTSIITGINNMDKSSAAMILLGDMPFVDAGLINTVIASFKSSSATVCAPFIGNRHGHPVVFHPRLFGDILKITGDQGCREIVLNNMQYVKKVVLDSDESQMDIDNNNGLIREKSQ